MRCPFDSLGERRMSLFARLWLATDVCFARFSNLTENLIFCNKYRFKQFTCASAYAFWISRMGYPIGSLWERGLSMFVRVWRASRSYLVVLECEPKVSFESRILLRVLGRSTCISKQLRQLLPNILIKEYLHGFPTRKVFDGVLF